MATTGAPSAVPSCAASVDFPLPGGPAIPNT